MFARFLFAVNWRATAGRPYGLCEIFNIVSTANHYIPPVRRDRARPCPSKPTKTKQLSTTIKLKFISNILLPLTRELLSVAKLRELKRLFQIIKTPSVIFSAKKNDSPLKDGAETQIEFDIDCGQGQALSLRSHIFSNLTEPTTCIITKNALLMQGVNFIFR